MVHTSTDRRIAQHVADQMFSRAAGAPLVGGNAVRVLRDAAENYPAWEAAIAGASEAIDVEMYIFRRDAVGRRFLNLLAERARAGVRVRLLYDWFGAGLSGALGLFAPLVRAGADVRPANPPSARAPLGWLSRDHRKLIVVDGRVAFVSGLGIAAAWEGDPAAGREPWRDTGVEIVGPVVADAAAAFADSWRRAGGAVVPAPAPDGAGTTGGGGTGGAPAASAAGAPAAPATSAALPPAPDAPVRVRLVATEPFAANLLRMDLLIAALARRTLWITDAYFVGTGSYVDALRRAAEDGVDVRLLLPRSSDVGWTVPLSRALYRPLLESGVRLFEWQGTMIHAKTAVADGRWSRIGSTNLNLNGWVGNWELDVAIEDEGVGATLEEHYMADLARATEIVAARPRPVRRWRPRVALGRRVGPRRAGQLARSATRLGAALGDVVVGRRALESLETAPVVGLGLALVAAGAVLAVAPQLLAWPLAFVAAWAGLALLVDGVALWRRRRR